MKQAKELTAILVGACVLIALLFLVDGLAQRRRSPVARPTPRPAGQSTAGRELVAGDGRGDEVSDDFTVPDGCLRQELTYSGRANDAQLNVAWVAFDALAADGQMTATSGPHDLLAAPEGGALWSLAPGRFAVAVTAGNAAWRYSLTCR